MTSINSTAISSYNQNLLPENRNQKASSQEAPLEVKIEEDRILPEQALSILQSATNDLSTKVTNLLNYVNSIIKTPEESQPLTKSQVLDNLLHYQTITNEFGEELFLKLKTLTPKLTTTPERERQPLLEQLKSIYQQTAETSDILANYIKDSNPAIQNSETLRLMQGLHNQNWLAAENTPSVVIESLANSGLLSSSTESSEQNITSGRVTYQYQSGSSSDASLMTLLLLITLITMENSYKTALIESDRGEMLNNKLNLVTALNQFLSTLDSFYKTAIEGINNSNGKDDADVGNINFDDKDIADASGDKDSGFDEKVAYQNGKNTWYVSADKLPEESLYFFNKASDGSIMVTSSGIQTYEKYVSDSTASVIPGYGNETNISSIFTDSALESAQIYSFETGLNNLIQQIQQLQSSAMSNATSDIDNADSTAKFFNDIFDKYNRLFF